MVNSSNTEDTARKVQEFTEPDRGPDTEAAEPVSAHSPGPPFANGDTSLKLYLRDLGQLKLLSPQEEIELAARIKNGDQHAREQMIIGNLRLVVSIARSYEGIGLPLMDLISEGNIGLTKAVERFDSAKGKLSTYAAWWIKQAMKRALAYQSKTIRLPVHLMEKISWMRRASLRLQEELGREPTDEELGEELDISASCMAQMRLAPMRPESLEAPLGRESTLSLAETIADHKATTPYRQLAEKSRTRMLEKMLHTLSRREILILRSRFGLDGAKPKTLEQTGELLGITRERVHQLQRVALEKLRTLFDRMDKLAN